MTKLPKDEPTVLPDGTQLHEELVKQTLKINPGLISQLRELESDASVQDFIRNQTGKLSDHAKKLAQERTVPKQSLEVRRLIQHLEGERRRHKEIAADIQRKIQTLDKQAKEERTRASRAVTTYLANHVRSVEDLDEILRAHKTFLEEIAASPKQITEAVAAKRRKQQGG